MIQIGFVYLYIKKMAETPINTRIFHVSQIGIYRYTDCLHIQREGKGEGKGPTGQICTQKGGHRIRIWDIGGHRPST